MCFVHPSPSDVWLSLSPFGTARLAAFLKTTTPEAQAKPPMESGPSLEVPHSLPQLLRAFGDGWVVAASRGRMLLSPMR